MGALAVMLGVGAALLAAPGLASADKADSGSPRSSADGTQGSKTNPSAGASRKSDDRDERRPSWSNAGKKGSNGAGSGSSASGGAGSGGASNGAGSGGSASNGAGAGGSASNRDRDDVADDDSRGNKPGRDDADTASVADADQSPNSGSDTAGSSPTPAESRADVEISVPPADTPHQPAAPAQDALLLTTAASSSVRRTDDGDAEGAGAADTTARGGPLSVTSPSTSTLTSTTSPVVSTNTATATVTAPPQDEVIEAESMAISRTRNGATYADPTASGGAAVVLNKNSSVSTTTALAEFTSLVIRAKGDQYLGAPKMRVSVNGSVVTTVAVAASTWTDYTIDYSGSAGTYTITVAFTNDLYSRKYGDRNLRLDSITAVAAVVEPPPPPPPDTSGPGYFGNAGWLWNPIGANPVIDPNSATWVSYLAASDAQRIANLYDYSVALVSASEITSTTPRYDVTLTQPWGSDPFGSTTVPIPAGTKVPPGSDGHLAILDPTTGTAYGIWQAAYDSTTDTWSGSWGGMTDLNGNGIDQTGSATAAAIARYAGVVTAEEFSAAIAANSGLNHALAFSTDLAGPDFVYPAIKSDGQNWAGVATPIPEGYRIQLDPTIDVDAIPGITAGEKVIAKTLQTHGAYVVDQGGARMAFSFELVDDATSSSPGSVWTDAGFSWDYYDMNKIPWTSLRVLAPATVVL